MQNQYYAESLMFYISVAMSLSGSMLYNRLLSTLHSCTMACDSGGSVL